MGIKKTHTIMVTYAGPEAPATEQTWISAGLQGHVRIDEWGTADCQAWDDPSKVYAVEAISSRGEIAEGLPDEEDGWSLDSVRDIAVRWYRLDGTEDDGMFAPCPELLDLMSAALHAEDMEPTETLMF